MKYANRVKTTTTTVGIGNITVGAAATRYRPLSDLTIGSDKVVIMIEDESGTDWELSECTILSATTFSRDTVIHGSAGPGVKVNFSAGTKTVICTVAAVQLDGFLTEVSLGALSQPLPAYLGANSAGTPGNTDLFAVARGGALLGATFTAVATAVHQLWTSSLETQVAIASTASLPLDFSVHNRRRLVCTATPSAITAPTLFATVGNGFSCKISNLSGVDITLTGITVRPSGSVIPNGASADVYATGGSIYADLYGIAAAAVAAVAPGQVTGLTAGTATESTQPLTWAAPATGTAPFTYKVEVSADSGTIWATAAAAVSGATAYTVTGRTASTSYQYRVSATNSAGTGLASAIVTASTAAAAATVPGQVTGLVAGTSTDTTQPLSWTAVSGATGYKVERSAAAANIWAVVVANTGSTGTTYTVTGLTASTSYDYRVSAINGAGTGPVSATVTKSTAAASGGGIAPFTATAKANFPLTLGPAASDYMWHDITTNGSPTITAVVFAVSTSNTIAPTTSIAQGTTPKGKWMGAAENYSGGTNWLIMNTQIISYSEAATDYYFWIRVTDSAGGVYWFCHTAPISIGTGVANTFTSTTTPTPQVVGA